MRTQYCGLVDEALIGRDVVLCGWVDTRRDHGGVVFVDLRDHEGLVQIVADPDNGSYLDSLGWAYFKQGKVADARTQLQRAATISRSNSVIQDHLGDVLMALDDGPGAIAAWERALAGDGESIDAAAIKSFGHEVMTRLCQRLIDGGAPALHFYTLNQATPTLGLCQSLGIAR